MIPRGLDRTPPGPAVFDRFSVPKGRRLIAISDIHGNLPYLRGLLEKLSFSRDDTLVIVGDILEKGPYSLETLQYVMALCREYDVHPLCGNCDFWHEFCDDPCDEQMDAWQRQYLVGRNKGWGDGLIAQMLGRIGIAIEPGMDLPAARRAVAAAFPEEIAFLKALPHIAETEDYVFVHGGYCPERGRYACMKFDNYRAHAKPHEKWTIVGHWPVVLYGEDIVSANPVIDEDLRLISIDGGCVLKDDGQLNALILPGMETVYYDPFPQVRVGRDQRANDRHYYIRHGDNLVRPLRNEGEFTLCEHIRTGYRMEILTDFLRRETELGVFAVNDCTDYRLPLRAGDEISIVRRTGRGYLCKHRGVSGWYDGPVE